MAWRALVENDLKVRISGPELAAFRAAALASGQADPIAAVFTQVTDEIRGYIAACERNTLGVAGSLPEKLVGTAIDLCVVEVMKRAGGIVIDPDGERKGAKDDAIRRLEQVAACAFAIEEPVTQDTESIATITPSFSGRTPEFGRELEEGL